MENEKILNYRKLVTERIQQKHLKNIYDSDGPVFYISDAYAGVWLEHCLDPVIWSEMTDDTTVAKNHLGLFMKHQKENGQLPFMVNDAEGPKYSHLQECVSFGSLCLDVYNIDHDGEFLSRCFLCVKSWVNWLETYRMPSQKGLIEAFCGYDTGHDNSPRHNGFKYRTAICDDAAVLPRGCGVLPGILPDINAVYFGNTMALAKMAEILGLDNREFLEKAEKIKERIFEICYDSDDMFFYDIDKNGCRRPNKTIAITNVLHENVPGDELSRRIFERHLWNENEFRTAFPFPAVSVSDPGWVKNENGNSWGYFSQALTALRATRWMPRIGKEKELSEVLERWVTAANSSPEPVFGQELDPVTGEFSEASPWYSSCMLLYLYATREER